MPPAKPIKTFADYLIIGISPVLIMLLVGSLSYFLIEVFFRGEALGSVRWVMFWFVLAVVLVSRISIEKGGGQAAVYGLALAAATWLYLVRIHPAFILGAVLLGLVWWCAHKLTWDCTLIDDEEDASGTGLLQTAGERRRFLFFKIKAAKNFKARAALAAEPAAASPPAPAKPHAPGLWLIWFSVAALPLFGLGQMLLPGGDQQARRAGFVWLFIYVTAALGLLLTTSFLGLRRYLRQRYLTMPASMAFGWIRFGGGVAVFVLMGALLLPRPGATAVWQTLGYQINYQLHAASAYAARFGPHGTGRGREGNSTDNSAPEDKGADTSGSTPIPGQTSNPQETQTGDSKEIAPHTVSPETVGQIYRWLKALLVLVVMGLAAWWLFRKRALLISMVQAVVAALKRFFHELFRWGRPQNGPAATVAQAQPKNRLFASYRNPFLLGTQSAWTPEQLVLYSYEALQAWAEEKGVQPYPQQTAREFCVELGRRFPEITDELRQLAYLYGHAAYNQSAPPGCDLEPVKKMWRFFGV